METEVVRKPAKIENMFKKSVKEFSIFVIQSINRSLINQGQTRRNQDSLGCLFFYHFCIKKLSFSFDFFIIFVYNYNCQGKVL